jgi:hypothetical protein
MGCQFHDAGLIYSGNPSKTTGPSDHVASGAISPDGCGALLRFLERKELLSMQG